MQCRTLLVFSFSLRKIVSPFFLTRVCMCVCVVSDLNNFLRKSPKEGFPFFFQAPMVIWGSLYSSVFF